MSDNKIICPKCGSDKYLRQRRPNGETECLSCGYRAKSSVYDSKTIASDDKVYKFERFCIEYGSVVADRDGNYVWYDDAQAALESANAEIERLNKYTIAGYEVMYVELEAENEKLKQLFAVQLDIIEQNKKLSEQVASMKEALQNIIKTKVTGPDIYCGVDDIMFEAKEALKKLEDK